MAWDEADDERREEPDEGRDDKLGTAREEHECAFFPLPVWQSGGSSPWSL